MSSVCWSQFGLALDARDILEIRDSLGSFEAPDKDIPDILALPSAH
jgi:hypothetical protein